MTANDPQMQALIGALRNTMTPQSGGRWAGLGQLAQSAADAHKKTNPTLYSKEGAFDWKKAFSPNQGWETTSQPASPPPGQQPGAMPPPGGPAPSIYGQQPKQPPRPPMMMGNVFGGNMGG